MSYSALTSTEHVVETSRKCKRLIAAIVEQALKDLQDDRYKASSEAFLVSERCEVMLDILGIYPDAFKEKVIEARKSGTVGDLAYVLTRYSEDFKEKSEEEIEAEEIDAAADRILEAIGYA